MSFSTDRDEQEESFETQCKHFTEIINARSEWEFGGIYADQGISGTKASSRKDFMRMITDCREGKINRVLVKSISRFARNTVDSLQYIRELKELGVSVFFESEQIDTLTPGGEVLITILSAIAEQESRNMSTNIKWAYQKRFKDGNVIIGPMAIGYVKEGEGYKIVDSEAKTVKRIYREFIGGATIREIGDNLQQDGILSPSRRATWSPSTIRSILQNEKYTGNAVLGKSFKPDVLSKCRLKNKGQAPSYYVQNSHPAIITQELYDIVQAEIKRRKELRSTVKTGDGKYSGLYALSGLLVCGDCGSKFRRYGRTIADGSKVATWVCITHQKEIEGCKMLPLKEDDVHSAYERVMNRISGDVSEVLQTVRNNIESELNLALGKDIGECDEVIIQCQKHILEIFKRKREGAISSEQYNQDYEIYSKRIMELQEQQNSLKERNLAAKLSRQRFIEINEILSSKNFAVTDQSIMKRLIESIKVISKHEIEFQFKCGIKTKESL